MAQAFDPFLRPINEIVLGGFKTPGFAEVRDLALEYDWEVRKGNAISGATKVLKGRGLTKFTVRVQLFDSKEIAAWEELVQKLRYPEKATDQDIKGYDVTHPLAAIYGIKSVTITRFIELSQLADNIWETGLELEEYREPVVIARKAKGSKTSPKPAETDPILNNPELNEATKELERQRALNKAAGL